MLWKWAKKKEFLRNHLEKKTDQKNHFFFKKVLEKQFKKKLRFLSHTMTVRLIKYTKVINILLEII